MDEETREELRGESVRVCHKCGKKHGKPPKWDMDTSVIHRICKSCSKKPDIYITYAALDPKLLNYCQKILYIFPHLKKRVFWLLDRELKNKKEDAYYSDLPHKWGAENFEEDSILFSNGVFFMEISKKDEEYLLTTTPVYFKNLELKHGQRKNTYSNVFEAISFATAIQQDLDDEWFKEQSNNPK